MTAGETARGFERRLISSVLARAHSPWRVRNGHLALAPTHCDSSLIDGEIVTREEIVALLFNVSDIARSLARIEGLLGGDDGEEEADEG